MIKKIFTILSLLLFSSSLFATGYDVFGIGIYDVKFDGSDTNTAADFRYERRFDKSLIEIGPETENFFYLKPFVGLEATSESATYFISGISIASNDAILYAGAFKSSSKSTAVESNGELKIVIPTFLA